MFVENRKDFPVTAHASSVIPLLAPWSCVLCATHHVQVVLQNGSGFQLQVLPSLFLVLSLLLLRLYHFLRFLLLVDGFTIPLEDPGD